jgi:hypothetical protein
MCGGKRSGSMPAAHVVHVLVRRTVLQVLYADETSDMIHAQLIAQYSHSSSVDLTCQLTTEDRVEKNEGSLSSFHTCITRVHRCWSFSTHPLFELNF